MRQGAGHICAALVLASAAQADAARALDLCLDNTLTLEARAAAFAADGWRRVEDSGTADAALRFALFASALDPANTAAWPEAIDRAALVAFNLRDRRGYDGATVLVRADGAAVVTIEPNGAGLHTCLYVGPETDLSTVVPVVPDAVLRELPLRASIRAETSRAAVFAHAVNPQGYASLQDPPAFTMTFTTVLDRGAPS